MRKSRHYGKRRLADLLRDQELQAAREKAAPEMLPGPRRLTRVAAQLILDEGIGRPKHVIPASLLINEVTPVGARLFSRTKLTRGQQITLNIPHIHNFYIKGKVTICKELQLNPGLLAAQVFPYRIELQWIYRSQAEREAVRKYCNFLATEYLDESA